jgi:hypothetical protein
MWQLWMFFFLNEAAAGPSRSSSWQLGQSHVARPVYRRWDRGEPIEAWVSPKGPLLLLLLVPLLLLWLPVVWPPGSIDL